MKRTVLQDISHMSHNGNQLYATDNRHLSCLSLFHQDVESTLAHIALQYAHPWQQRYMSTFQTAQTTEKHVRHCNIWLLEWSCVILEDRISSYFKMKLRFWESCDIATGKSSVSTSSLVIYQKYCHKSELLQVRNCLCCPTIFESADRLSAYVCNTLPLPYSGICLQPKGRYISNICSLVIWLSLLAPCNQVDFDIIKVAL